MAGVAVTFGIAGVADIAQIQGEMAKVGSVMKQTPLEIGVNMTGLDLGTNSSEAKSFFDQIQAGATNVEKLTVISKEFRDTAGNTFMVPVTAIQKFKGGIGAAADSTKLLNQAMIESEKAAKGWTETGNLGKSVLDIGAAGRQTAKEFNTVAKTFDTTEKSVDRFLSKSNNMSGRQVEDARKVGLAIKAEKAEFDRFFRAQDWDNAAKSADKIRTLTDQFNNLKSATAAGANVFQSWGERMSNAIKQTISYGLSIKLVREAQQLLNDAVKYAIDLNTEMTKIYVLQTEGAQTPEQINNLAQSFNNLGQQMGVSTLEVAKGSVEWLRQGRTIEETEKLLVSSLQLAKLGAMDSADATNYLTSITNAFKISAEDAATVVDKLIAVDNIAATSAGELATALRYTSESAAIAGVSMEQLVSYIGTVSTVTRQNAEMIGQAFKTMFARMTQIQGGGLDETGQSISKVEAALKKVNIEIKNTDGSWLGMGDVLEQVAAKWSTLTTREQVEIATAVAGVRQKEAFLVLMNNMDKALTYQAAQVDSLGLANERYGKYLESVQAKQGKIQAQLQELFTETINSKMISRVLDLASAFLQLVDDIGGLEPIIILITSLFLALKARAIAGLLTSIPQLILALAGWSTAAIIGSGATMTLAGAFTALNIAMGPIGWALLAISVAVAAVGAVIAYNNKKLADHKKAIDDAAKSVENYIDKVNAIPGTIRSAESTIERVNELLTKKQKVGLDKDELYELNDLFIQLKEILPNLDWKYADGSPYLDKATLAALDLKKAITEQTYASNEEAQAFLTTLGEQVSEYDRLGTQVVSTYKQIAILKQIQEELTKDPKALRSWLRNFWDTHDIENYTEAEKEALDNLRFGLELLIANDPFITPEEIAASISTSMETAWGIIRDNPRTQGKIRDASAELISVAYSTQDPELIKAVEKMYADAYTDPAFQAFLGKLIKEAQGRAWGKAAGEWSMALTAPPPPETNEEKLARQNKEYEDAIRLVNRLAPAIQKLNNALNKEGDNAVDVQTAIADLNVEIEKLANETGIEVPTKSFLDLANATGTALDPKKVEDYRNELIEWLANNTELQVSNETLYNMVLNNIEALDVAIKSATVTLTDTFGNAYTLTAQQADEATQWLAESVYNMGKDTNGALVLTLETGQQITVNSSDRILEAMERGYINWTVLMDNATAYALQKGIDLANQLSALLAGFASGLPFFPSAPIGGGSGGGSGGKRENPNQEQIDDLEDKIKAHEEEKKAIEEKIKAYKDYIEAQKESLKRDKEEADFQDELAKKHKDLGKIKARLAVLALDNSEEALKEREELEAKAAEKEEDITETVENRKYDLKIQALDDMAKAFEDAQQLIIKGIEEEIEEFKKLKAELSEQSGGGGGGGGGGSFGSWAAAGVYSAKQIEAAVQAIIDRYKQLGIEVGFTKDAIQRMLEDNIAKYGDLNIAILQTITQMERLKTESINAMNAINAAIAAGNVANTGAHGGTGPNVSAPKNPFDSKHGEEKGEHKYGEWHQGGIVEKHHTGNFAGNLMSNEVFAKLLKGEYVATEGEMSNFLKNILPKISTGIAPSVIGGGGGGNKSGDIILDIDINVAGSLDKSVLPDLEKRFMKVVNKALEIKGVRRTAGNFTI